jgi:urease accessory protein UreF
LLEEVAAHHHDPLLVRYNAEVRGDARLGTHPVAFGFVSAVLGVKPADVAPTFMFSTAMAILQASLRLLPVSHRDVQAIMHRLRSPIAELAAQVRSAPPEILSFNPLQEIASMRHASAPVRLFAS